MSHKTLIGGKSYEITTGRTLVNGKGYEIASGRTLVGGKGYDIPFGIKISTLPVGEIVYAHVDSVPMEFRIVHHGKPSDFYDDSCDGTWLLMENCYDVRPLDTNNGIYRNSTTRTYLNDEFLKLLSDRVVNNIKEVQLPHCGGTVGDTAENRFVSNLPTKIFLLSAREVTTRTLDAVKFANDGSTLAYFDNDDKMVAKFNGEGVDWYTRSYDGFLSGTWVKYRGLYEHGNSTVPNGIRPAFIVDGNTRVKKDNTII